MNEPPSISEAASTVHMFLSPVSLVLGACIGSFLNVVIYRWSRGLSVVRPARSFCPHCGHGISPWENIPVVSYACLRGRCRSCRRAISLQYPLVELATAFLFFMTYDLFFVARERAGIESLGSDWPMLLAHWALWGGLLVIAIMDLEAYTIDIRVTWIVTLIGIVAHLVWTPASSHAWIRPGPAGAAMTLAAAIGLAVGAMLFLRRIEVDGSKPPPGAAADPPASAPAPESPDRVSIRPWLWLLVACVLVAAYVFALWRSDPQPGDVSVSGEPIATLPDSGAVPVFQDAGAIRLLVGFALVYVSLTLVASRPQPQADAEIVEALHAEARQARPQAMWELKLISPAILLGSAALLAVLRSPQVASGADQVLHWQPVGAWQPVWGLSTALSGWIIGGAVGWIARIVFTLILGKEALGMGDIHLMAAAGAIAGWPVTVMGFFAAAFLTLGAILVIQFRRQSRAVAYVPWLALGFLLCCMFQDRVLDAYGVRPWLTPAVSSGTGAVRPPARQTSQAPPELFIHDACPAPSQGLS